MHLPPRSNRALPDTRDLDELKNQLLAAGPYAYSPGLQRDVAQHLKRLEGEFAGRSPLLLRHALLVVLIRRSIGTDAALDAFFGLWSEQRAFLLRELDIRWLKSACDTLADHGRTPAQRTLGVATSILINVVKAYETERQLSGGSGTADPGFQGGRTVLFDGLRSFKVGWGDMIRNMAERIHAVSALDDLAGAIFEEVFARLHRNDTVLRRFLEQNRKPELAWAELPPPDVETESRPAIRGAEIAYDAKGGDFSFADLVERAASGNPGILGAVPREQADSILRPILRELLRAIAATQDGSVTLKGLGEFRVRNVERVVDGRKLIRRHVVFRSDR